MSGEPDVRFDEGVQETSDTVTRRRPTLQAVLPVGRVRGAYGGAEAPPFRDPDVTPIYVTKH